MKNANSPRSRALRKGRVSICGQVYLLTAVTHERRPVFSDFINARLLIRSMQEQHDAGRVESLAFAVLPDHVHWLVLLKAGTLSTLLKGVKGASARRINSHAGFEGPLWQTGYHDHALRRDEDLREAARYLIANPVRAGLVERVMDYPHWDAVWFEP